ncbi:hypothetical protein EDD85DRAFT_790952 [Armillaria nabsnona]|nr:hypothetical protein EDD85DRAFT_790952 [Armillaria nabsnona]
MSQFSFAFRVSSTLAARELALITHDELLATIDNDEKLFLAADASWPPFLCCVVQKITDDLIIRSEWESNPLVPRRPCAIRAYERTGIWMSVSLGSDVTEISESPCQVPVFVSLSKTVIQHRDQLPSICSGWEANPLIPASTDPMRYKSAGCREKVESKSMRLIVIVEQDSDVCKVAGIPFYEASTREEYVSLTPPDSDIKSLIQAQDIS